MKSCDLGSLLFGWTISCTVVFGFGLGETACADERDKVEFFEKRIRPVLIQSCYECHSAQTAEPMGGLRLDSRAGLLAGGESGPAVAPGKPAESLLIDAIRYESLEMPPKNRLPDEVIADFVTWIEQGAIDPRDEADPAATGDPWPEILAARSSWWSLQPVADPKPPTVNSEWPTGNLDQFILGKLEAAGLQPAPPASSVQLVRRLSLVLTGLPPTSDAIDRFQTAHAKDPASAYAALVDDFLDSPHFGERWGRHWMDVVRFTETHGNEWNYEVHHAWRYRDYLIRAFNSDVPYDLLVREHIAGDLLESPRWNEAEQLNESVIGTSFYRFGEVNHDDCVTLTSLGYDILDNQIDTLSKAFQATTIACARCHDHKIDAVSSRDYYALLGVLKSSRPTAQTIDTNEVNRGSLAKLRELKAAIRTELVTRWRDQASQFAEELLAAQAAVERNPTAAPDSNSPAANLEERWLKLLSANRKPAIDDPLWAWSRIVDHDWSELTSEFQRAQTERSTFNQTRFTEFADFRRGVPADWYSSGHGLRGGASPSGELTITVEGNQSVGSVLPAGLFTHTLSQKLNGTLRSPVFPAGTKYISALVLGEKTSALRLVSNNCQLNYANYRALTSAQSSWITFKVPEAGPLLQTCAELVTKFDNPKFPDQLGTLGGDTKNDRVPWAEAAADPRSYFGIQRLVTHTAADPPLPELAPLLRLLDPTIDVEGQKQLAQRYEDVLRASIDSWNESPSDDDVFWLSWALNNGLLDHTMSGNLKELVHEYREIEEHEVQLPRLAPGLADAPRGYDHPLLERGDPAQVGDVIPRGYLEVLSERAAITATGSGRRELAELLASPHNPLTARVLVNRVWHYMFGTGIVRTVDDFGRVGELPTHPELLDFLSSRFMAPRSDNGMAWSIKSLIREIALSATFQMSNRRDPHCEAVDPQNRLLHRYPARRMEAEAIRDSILRISGRLDAGLFGMSVHPYRQETNATRRLFKGPLDGEGRRSIYIKMNLMEGPKFLGAFNLPGGKVTQGRRDVTRVPAQALALLNDPFVQQQAGHWAQRVLRESPDSAITPRLTKMFTEAVGRPPKGEELARFLGFVRDLAEVRGVGESEIASSEAVWKDVAHLLFNLTEFIYIP